ncbi:glycoside hydrolase family 15 protein [Spirosoma taeanense]|uniref:Glycoside hydrolase family 15 protein n=1 Tax=Spirosoma taeanense TaxID=2735870 RepID=A0A6M5Y804_9BACT|nr:glycoside hydrolase family 15 protein [Spirosoma taeanense]QJW89506.1 glycoside hydrolase family 15 protein [Spirosoma taeanense]
MKYQPIENYGIIGDLNTVALVGLHGSIDFLCFPMFDSPSVFSALLDADKGGFFRIYPVHEGVNNLPHNKQLYLPDTNVLLTRFLSVDGVGEITDFMPVEDLYPGHALIRRVTTIRGKLTYRMECNPRFNYARSTHRVEQHDEAILFRSDGPDATVLRLVSNVPLTIQEGDAYAEFTLDSGQQADFTLELDTQTNSPQHDLSAFVTTRFQETVNFWKSWIDQSSYRGRWMEVVHRSALVLKLLTSSRYGAPVAAPTFSLPEAIGGSRNWDYRYTWIRDASFTVYTLLRLGYEKEAGQFMNWVEKQCGDIGQAGLLRLMYTLDGHKELEEVELEHLEGYKGSSPVRIGNAASKQVQLDIYGELLDAVYQYDKFGERISYDFWQDLCKQVEWVCDNWQWADQGIWEVRGGQREFLYSRLMCWVAIDRALKIGSHHSYPLPERWTQQRDRIFHTIHQDFWSDKLQSFVQYKGAETVDAATLLMPLVKFISPKDPRWLSTLRQIEEVLVSDSLVYRYRPDESLEGLTGSEGTFAMCTFWYVECLSRSGQLHKARLFFEKMLGYANHLGLYAEQLGLCGEHLGNFPQAFTHLGLISAALNLNDQLDNERNKQSE